MMLSLTLRSPARLLSAFLGVLALASPALAQDIATAKALFNRGLADMQTGQYETGCRAIAESQRLDPRPGTLFTLAVCEMRWGRTATAVARYVDYLSLYERLAPDQQARQADRAKEAKAQRDALAAEVPQLSLELPPGAPANTVVSRDGVVLAQPALGMELPVDPGEHVVTTQAPGGPVWEQRITIGKSEKKKLTLEVKSTPPLESPPPKVGPPPSKVEPPSKAEGEAIQAAKGPSRQRVTAYVVGGVGVVGLGLGGVMGGLTLQKKEVVNDNCGIRIHAAESMCNQKGLNAANSGKTLALVSTIGIGVGIAAIGTAVVLFLTEPKAARPTTGAPRRWMTAGVLDAGPSGTVVGVHGRW